MPGDTSATSLTLSTSTDFAAPSCRPGGGGNLCGATAAVEGVDSDASSPAGNDAARVSVSPGGGSSPGGNPHSICESDPSAEAEEERGEYFGEASGPSDTRTGFGKDEIRCVNAAFFLSFLKPTSTGTFGAFFKPASARTFGSFLKPASKGAARGSGQRRSDGGSDMPPSGYFHCCPHSLMFCCNLLISISSEYAAHCACRLSANAHSSAAAHSLSVPSHAKSALAGQGTKSCPTCAACAWSWKAAG
mmetsp:Transcript_90420/g.193863  ORF Transcript_90420/g.193863 Transcript_90420/m.193863 type:complete len:247 (-) Transcript_90420:84-824(-)